MDLIDKIKNILRQSNDLKAPVIDIHFDNQDNIIGYVADEIFDKKNEKEAQEIIWNTLKKKLETEELIKVLSIFPETFHERSERLVGYHSKITWHSNFWLHDTPEAKRYWLFIGVGNFKEKGYKSFYLIVNQKDDFKKGLTFVYDQEILEFMELESSEVYNELYTNTFDYADNEIKVHLMEKHEKFSEKGLWGKANIFSYVFDNFKLSPISKKQLIFNPAEISIIEKAINELDDFDVKNDILEAIKESKKFNGNIRQIA